MRKLLAFSVIFWGGVAKPAAQPDDKAFRSNVFLHTTTSSISPKFAFPFDTIPIINPGEYIVTPKVTKSYDVIFFAIPADLIPVETDSSPLVNTNTIPERTPILKITGNILYDVNYRSRIDTPYAENNVHQHTLQTRLDIVYKDKYPLKVYFTSRFSNSALFRNYTDFNVRFNPSDFKRMAKQQLMESVKGWLANKSGNVDSVYQLIEAKKAAIASLRQSLEKPDIRQKVIEERERVFYNRKNRNAVPGTGEVKDRVTDSVNAVLNNRFPDEGLASAGSLHKKADTITARLSDYRDSIETKKQVIDSLMQELEQLESLYRKIKGYSEQDLTELKRQIDEEKDVSKLADKLRQLNLPDSILPKGYKMLSGIQLLNIGRSIADYSELSVRNISITGVQAEYNAGYYYAVAAGRVDYRFRDYIVPDRTRSDQYVALVRFGKGTRDGNHVFLTWYTGKRQLFNSSVSLQDGSSIPGYHLAGITIEGVYKISRNITITGEIAKSTTPYYSPDSLKRKNWMSSIGNLNSRRNEAYAVKLSSFFPKTMTRFNGYLSYTGADFQSFSTFTTGAAQLRWMARLEQPFFKKQLTVISTLQRNNYFNPFVATAYRSASLLASVQANLQVKKYPTVSLGYFPAYQLTKAGDDHFSESRYYTLMGSAGYSYRLGQLPLSSYVVYSRFYNDAVDSGFVYYNSKNLLLSQTVNFNRFSILVNGSLSTGSDYMLRILENTLQVAVNKIISLGGGLKMISYSLLPAMQWGYSGNLTLSIPKIGDIQLMADKGFIPGLHKQLAENKTGRLIFYKTF